MVEETQVPAVMGETGIAEVANDQAVALAVGSGSGGYLARLQLMTSNSQPCKDGLFPINHYAIVDNGNFDDLGTDVQAHVLAYRPLALDFSDDVVAVYDPMLDSKNQPTGEFARIKAAADASSESECMYGVQFLLYIPARDRLVTLMLGTKTARREVPTMVSKRGTDVTLSAKKIETKKYTYFSIKIDKCTEELDVPISEIAPEIEKFCHPKAIERTPIEQASPDRER
jgi:hypothetical protein